MREKTIFSIPKCKDNFINKLLNLKVNGALTNQLYASGEA